MCYVVYSYKHDDSETLVDDVEFTATDGTNSVDFVLQVKVMTVTVPLHECGEVVLTFLHGPNFNWFLRVQLLKGMYDDTFMQINVVPRYRVKSVLYNS